MQTMRKATYSRAYFHVFSLLPLLGGRGAARYSASMAFLSLYLSILTLLLTTSATTMCLATYGAFKHRAAFWLSMCMIGLAFFALTILVSLIEGIGGGTVSPGAAPYAGARGFDLLWQAMGSIIVAHSLPRFLLAAFGGAHGKATYRLLDAVSAIIVVLSIIRVATGWNDAAAVAAVPNGILRVALFALVGGALALTLVFQSRLPDRSLYKAVVVQAGALILLFPFVVLEDLGLFAPPGFPQLAGQVLILATCVSATLHARKSLMRPKYVADKAPSAFFAEHFGISGRELEIVAGVLEGLGNIAIAERLFISPRTVEKHLYNVYQKAGHQEPAAALQPLAVRRVVSTRTSMARSGKAEVGHLTRAYAGKGAGGDRFPLRGGLPQKQWRYRPDPKAAETVGCAW